MAPQRMKKKILVIDDDEMVFAYLHKKIGERYDLITTTQALIAVKIAVQKKPDLILCDIDMPTVAGGELSAMFSECSYTRNTPFAYLTSYVSPSEVRELKGNVGGRPGIAKATPVDEMIERIDQLLDEIDQSAD